MKAATLLQVKNVIENSDLFKSGKIEITADVIDEKSEGSSYEVIVKMVKNPERFYYISFASQFDGFNEYGTLSYLRSNSKGHIELVIF